MREAGAADGGHPCSCDPVTSGHLQRGPAVFSRASRNAAHLEEMGGATWAERHPEKGGRWSQSPQGGAPSFRMELFRALQRPTHKAKSPSQPLPLPLPVAQQLLRGSRVPPRSQSPP